MKKITRILTLLLIFTLIAGVNPLDAQSYGKKKKRKKRPETTEKVDKEEKEENVSRDSKTKKEKTDDYFDESGGFAHKLWFGGGLNLGFSGNQAVSVFNAGISPMVGYKITDNFSVGPRIGFNYSYIKFFESGRNYVVEPISISVGAFSRYKILNTIFAHVEYEYVSEESIDPDLDGRIVIDLDDEIVTGRINQDNFYIGLGYNSGGIFAYEISLLYNVLEPEESFQTPFNIRAGFTYKF